MKIVAISTKLLTLKKNLCTVWCWRCFVLPVIYIFTWLYPVHSFPMSRPALTLRICSLKGTIVLDSPLVLPHMALGGGSCQLALECWHEQLTGQSRQAVKETVRLIDYHLGDTRVYTLQCAPSRSKSLLRLFSSHLKLGACSQRKY